MARTVKVKDGSPLVIDGAHATCHDSQGKVVAMDGGIVASMNLGLIDADDGVFFQRQLEYIKARSYDVQYADLPARNLFPVSNDGGPGITTITYRTYDQVGLAKIINAYANDLPRADISGKETSIPVRSVATSYGYNLDEIQASQLTGASLDQRRANAASRSVEQVINSIAFFGDADSGLPGLFSNPNIPKGAAVDGGSGTEITNKTPDQVLFDFNDLAADVFETTRMVERINRYLMPPAQWSYIMSTPRASNSDTTIAQFLAQNSPYINSTDDLVPVNECASENNPLETTDVIVAYNANPDKLQLEIPVELEYLPVQQKNLEFVVPGRARVGGLNVYYPLSISILTDI